MPIEAEPSLATLGPWTYRVRPSNQTPGRLLLLLHGYTGDENSMWVFTRNLPGGYALLSPRAPYPAPEQGFSWCEVIDQGWGFPSLDDLRPAAGRLLAFLDDWSASASFPVDTFDVMGFSQGGGMACALSLLHPGRVGALAVLSSYLPAGSEALLASRPLAGRKAFVSFGTHDDLIPVEKAGKLPGQLEASGAEVASCISATAHKIGLECIKGLESFFGSIYNNG